MSETEPRPVRCVNCPLGKSLYCEVHGGMVRATVLEDGSIEYGGFTEVGGITSGRKTADEMAVDYPRTFTDFERCREPIHGHEPVPAKGFRGLFGLKDIVEINLCGAIYEAEFVRVVEDIIDRNQE